MAQLSGKVVRKGAEIITIIKVDGKYYPANGYNSELFETYLHTGDDAALNDLIDEVEL